MLIHLVIPLGGASDRRNAHRHPRSSWLATARGILFALIALASPTAALSATFVVNSTGDSGDLFIQGGTCDTGVFVPGIGGVLEPECTLRAAIEQANFLAGVDEIQFSDALNLVAGTVVISPGSPLPTITEAIEIRGDLAPTYDPLDPNESPVIHLNGAILSASGDHGLTISGIPAGRAHVWIRALAIIDFPGRGISIENSAGTHIEGCHIGVSRGVFAVGNASHGIFEDASSSNSVIGFVRQSSGRFEGLPNVIADSGGNGIQTAGTGTTIVGNRIGTDRTGNMVQVPFGGFHGNAGWGIWIRGANTEVGGGTGAAPNPGYDGNVISGNVLGGIYQVAGATDSVLFANRIGTNLAGTTALGNGPSGRGILVEGNGIEIGTASPAGATDLATNVISGNESDGIFVNGASGSILIRHNHIGLNLAGNAALGNGGDGIRTNSDGDGPTIHNNVIGSNDRYGIFVGNDGGSVFSNWIGTTPEGNAFGNGLGGIELRGNNTVVGGDLATDLSISPNGANIIRFNQGPAIRAASSFSDRLTFRGNQISNNATFTGGIDIGPLGREINDTADADSGTNRLQNNPDISSDSHWNGDAGAIRIAYSVAGFPGFVSFPLTVDFYLAGGQYEPATYLATTSYTNFFTTTLEQTIYVYPDPALGVGAGARIVGIATDSLGNSSEVSLPRTLPEPGLGVALAVGAVALGSLRRARMTPRLRIALSP